MSQIKLTRERAFTLIELLVVILIIAVLIAVALPSFLGQTDKAHDSAVQQQLAIVYRDAKAAETSNGQTYPTGAALQNAITASEPELNGVLTNTDSPSAGQLGICASTDPTPDSASQLALVATSQSGHQYLLTASDNTGMQLGLGNCQGPSGAQPAASFPLNSTTAPSDAVSGGPTLTNFGASLGTDSNTGAAALSPAVAATSFNGTGAYMRFNSSPWQGQSAVSFTGWMKWNGGGAFQSIFDFGNGTNSLSVYMTPSDGSHMVFEYTAYSGNNSGSVSGPIPQTGVWNFFAVTEDSAGNTVLYENGQQIGTATISVHPSNIPSMANSLIGTTQYGNTPLNGSLSLLNFYQQALTPAQVLAIYNAEQ